MRGHLESTAYPWSPSIEGDLANPALVNRARWIVSDANTAIERMGGNDFPVLPHSSEIETLSESQLNQVIILCEELPSASALII